MRRFGTWMVVGVLFLCVNIGGFAMAMLGGEVMHAAVHGVLAFVTAILIGQAAARRIAMR